MNVEKEKYNHEIYKYVEDPSKADCMAWAFLDTQTLVKFPYSHPELKEDFVRLKVTYVGLCYSDCHNVRGKWGKKIYPLAPGHEIVGIVTEVGKAVTKFKPGDKVLVGVQRESCTKCKYVFLEE